MMAISNKHWATDGQLLNPIHPSANYHGCHQGLTSCIVPTESERGEIWAEQIFQITEARMKWDGGESVRHKSPEVK